MKDKQYDPAGSNEQSPAEGMASVNTHSPEEEIDLSTNRLPEEEEREKSKSNKHNEQ